MTSLHLLRLNLIAPVVGVEPLCCPFIWRGAAAHSTVFLHKQKCSAARGVPYTAAAQYQIIRFGAPDVS